MNSFLIGQRLVGESEPPLVIAELGINHNGSLEIAIEMAEAAISAGAEIIKNQTHTIWDEMSEEAKSVIPGNADVSIYEIIKACAMSEDDEFALKDYVTSRGAMYFSTPFSRSAVDRIRKMDLPVVKIGSGECNNIPLIKYVARLGKPIILSTGMNSIETIRPAVEIIRAAQIPFALMHCTNLYPTPEHLIQLGAIEELRAAFPDAVLGLSDHSLSNSACYGAVALGASILERHFTDSRDRVGPDIICSMEPSELTELIRVSSEIRIASGGNKRPSEEEGVTIAFAFASVVATDDIEAGSPLTEENIWVMRPSGGDFSAMEYESLIGRVAKNRIPKNYQVKREDIL